jgi:hypothetical protein
MLLERNERCANCKFRQLVNEPGQPRQFQCHFWPPRLQTYLLGLDNGVPRFGDMVKFTPVAASDWCGQWKPAIETPET